MSCHNSPLQLKSPFRCNPPAACPMPLSVVSPVLSSTPSTSRPPVSGMQYIAINHKEAKQILEPAVDKKQPGICAHGPTPSIPPVCLISRASN